MWIKLEKKPLQGIHLQSLKNKQTNKQTNKAIETALYKKIW